MVLLDYLHVLHGDQSILNFRSCMMLFFNNDCELCEKKVFLLVILHTTFELYSSLDFMNGFNFAMQSFQ